MPSLTTILDYSHSMRHKVDFVMTQSGALLVLPRTEAVADVVSMSLVAYQANLQTTTKAATTKIGTNRHNL